MSHLNYLLVLIVIAVVLSAGIHIFSKGFLLTRISNENKSNCQYFIDPVGKCIDNKNNVCKQEIFSNDMLDNNICYRQNHKVVLIIIDALKYEFGLYNESLSEPLPYQNKLSIMKELQEEFPHHTRMLKFLADPPTTTLQRLKGITTGSLPTFIDMGSNFATPEINEDNFIYQAHANNLTSIFMGDSTWTELFPKHFRRHYSFPSFNIHDLDTVDREIEKILPKEIEKSGWNLIVAHFLGVDHAGHRYGPLHAEMSRKLLEMNGIIKQTIQQMDNDTTLFVIGDHGMTMTGDHGGSSDEEIEALLFAYSKGKPFISSTFDNDVDVIHQIDLAPTLSSILGLPSPLSNLGTISFQLLTEFSLDGIKPHQILQHFLWQNAKQVYNYIQKYSQTDDNFIDDNLEEFLTNFDIFEQRVKSLSSEEAFLSFSKDLKHELKNILDQCRKVWVKFNPHLMTQGLMLTFLVIFVMVILTSGISLHDFKKIFTDKLSTILIVFNVLGIIFSFVINSFVFVHESLLSNVFILAVGNILIFGVLIIQNWTQITDELHVKETLKLLHPRSQLLVISAVYFSNSFVVREQQILGYLLSSSIILTLFGLRSSSEKVEEKSKSGLSNVNKLKCILGIISTAILIRYSYTYFKCREEQKECWEDYSRINSKGSNDFDFISIACMIFLVILSRIFLKVCGNLTGFSFHVIFVKFGLILSLVAASAYLVLSQKNTKTVNIPPLHLDILAHIVFFIFIIECIVILINPLMLYLVYNENSQSTSISSRNNIPEIYRHFKNIFNRKSENSENIPIVYGFASLYSSVFIAFGTCLFIVIAIILGKVAIKGIVIVIFIGIFMIFISSVLKLEQAKELKELIEPNFSLVVSWIILCSYGFYATSHQPTISQIEWDAAFVGRKSNFDHSSPISIILVLLNTFNSQILLLVVYPLLVIIPFMIGAVFPQFSKKIIKAKKDEKSTKVITLNDEIKYELSRGEINLLENENLFLSSVFKVGCQLMILQSIKVFASMIACTILCRHLMVWKIFAPRFIYEGIASYISFVCIVIGYAITMRLNASSKSFVDMINNKKK